MDGSAPEILFDGIGWLSGCLPTASLSTANQKSSSRLASLNIFSHLKLRIRFARFWVIRGHARTGRRFHRERAARRERNSQVIGEWSPNKSSEFTFERPPMGAALGMHRSFSLVAPRVRMTSFKKFHQRRRYPAKFRQKITHQAANQVFVLQALRYECGTMSSIGVFDSGFGGLTVLKALLEVIPSANY